MEIGENIYWVGWEIVEGLQVQFRPTRKSLGRLTI